MDDLTPTVRTRSVSTAEAPGRPFSALLREYRLGARISQEELAERARLSAKTIGALERGERQSPYRETIDLLASALDLSVSERHALTAAARRRRIVRGSGVDPAQRRPEPVLPHHNLPLETNRLIGRDPARLAVADLLATVRLVTLVGPGGIGKTRLAAAVATDVMHRFRDGAWLVELTTIAEIEAVAAAIAAVCRIALDPARPAREALVAGLRERRMLLVLDNCEHLVAEIARIAADVLAGCAGVTLLATSREPLRARGEHAWQVPALSLPGDPSPAQLAASDSAALFLERARAIRPELGVGAADGEALVTICRRLDGLPLALELAAARVGTLSLTELARALDNRLRVLVGGERNAAARHQALRTTIAWSYDLLGPQEQTLFRRIGVFVDGFTLDMLVDVCADADLGEPAVFSALSSLVEKSLVIATIGERSTRYGLLESTLEFAREMLAASTERDALAKRHAVAMLAFVRAHGWEMWESPDPGTVAALAPEIDNIRAALRYCLDERNAQWIGAQLVVAATALFRRFDRRAEMERRIYALLETPRLDPAVEAAANYELLYSMYAAPERQLGAGRRAVALLAELGLHARHAHASALLAQTLAVCFGRYAEAQPLIDVALRFAREEADDPALLDQVLRLASQALPPDAHAQRRQAGAQSVALARASGIDRRIADALITAAEVEFAAGAYADALQLGREALAVQRRIANTTGLALQLTNVAAYALAARDVATAYDCACEALPLAREAQSRLAMLLAIQHVAGVLIVRDGDAVRAAQLLGFVDAQLARASGVRETTEQHGYERDRAAIEAMLGRERANAERAIGALLTDERALDEAVRPAV